MNRGYLMLFINKCTGFIVYKVLYTPSSGNILKHSF